MRHAGETGTWIETTIKHDVSRAFLVSVLIGCFHVIDQLLKQLNMREDASGSANVRAGIC